MRYGVVALINSQEIMVAQTDAADVAELITDALNTKRPDIDFMVANTTEEPTLDSILALFPNK